MRGAPASPSTLARPETGRNVVDAGQRPALTSFSMPESLGDRLQLEPRCDRIARSGQQRFELTNELSPATEAKALNAPCRADRSSALNAGNVAQQALEVGLILSSIGQEFQRDEVPQHDDWQGQGAPLL